MRLPAAFAVFFVLGLAGPALAQTAQPLDALATIQQYEDPSGNPSQLNYEYGPQHTAAGLYQISIPTWNGIAQANNLPLVGPGTPNANVGALPANTQTAGGALLFQQSGFGPWICQGCDALLASYVQQQGGQSAFALTGAENATLAQADPAALTGAAPGTTEEAAALPSTAGTGGITASAGFSGTQFQPFCWLWNEYQSAVATPLNNQVSYIQSQAATQIQGLLVLLIMVAGYLLFYANMSMKEAGSKLLRAVFVIPLVSDAGTYNSWVVAPVNGIVNWLAQGLGVATSGTCPVSLFDGVLQSYASHVGTTWANTPSSIGYMILVGLMIVGSALVIGLALAVLYAVWLVAQALLEIILIEGPILLLGLLFDYTRGLFDRWVGALILLALVVFSADMLSALFVGVINAALGQVAPTNSALMDGLNLVSVALVVVVLAAALVVLPRLLEHMAAAAGAPAMSGAHNWLSRNVYQPATRMPARARAAAERWTRP